MCNQKGPQRAKATLKKESTAWVNSLSDYISKLQEPKKYRIGTKAGKYTRQTDQNRQK